MINSQGLVHFTIPVKDLDRSEKFYMEVMGFEKVRRNSHMVFMRAKSDFFVLTHSEKPIDPNVEGSHDIHTAFRVTADEYEHAKKFLAANNIKIFKEEDRNTGTFRGRSAYFHDPDKNVLEIIELRMDPMDAVAEEKAHGRM